MWILNKKTSYSSAQLKSHHYACQKKIKGQQTIPLLASQKLLRLPENAVDVSMRMFLNSF